MSVPSRIGLILIIALAVVDAVILMSGARHAASAIQTHAMVEMTDPTVDAGASTATRREPLLSSALRQINLIMMKTRMQTSRI
jgi:hypothetical protein